MSEISQEGLELDSLERKMKMKMEKPASIPFANIFQLIISKDYKPKSPNSKSEEKYINHIYTFYFLNLYISESYKVQTIFSSSIIY